MENMLSSAASSRSHKTANGRRHFLPPPVSAAIHSSQSHYGHGVVRRAVLHAGTELGASLFARHHHRAVGRSRIVRYRSAAAADQSCRPRLRLACQLQGLDRPSSLQRRMELLRLHCQGLALRPDYFDGHPEDIDVNISQYPPCSSTSLMLGLPPPPASSRCCDIEDDARDALV